jgi:hypothetical protein
MDMLKAVMERVLPAKQTEKGTVVESSLWETGRKTAPEPQRRTCTVSVAVPRVKGE